MYIDPRRHKLDKKWRKQEQARREALRIAAERPVDHCPGCGYSLSGLTTEPCPECGMTQGQRTEIYAELELEHSANILGLRACAELWRWGIAAPFISMVLAYSWTTVSLTLFGIVVFLLSKLISDRAQNPMDTPEEMFRFSRLRLFRQFWAAFSIAMLFLVAIVSGVLVFARFAG